MKNIRVFFFENFQVLEVKFFTYLNRRVFVIDLKFEVLITECPQRNNVSQFQRCMG